MDSNNWRPPQGGEPSMDAGDWRSQLQSDSRQRIVNKIMDTLKRHLPFSGQEGLHELKKIAVRFEEKIYTAATSQSDYLRKISLKMLTMETKSQSTMANSLQTNPASNSNRPPDPGSFVMQPQVPNQGQSLPMPLPANQSQTRQQLLSQNIQNNIPPTGVQSSAGLPSALPPASGLTQTPVPSIVGQSTNMQSMSGTSQNSLGNPMGQGVPSNMFANSQRQMPGRQQVVPQQQQQQSQNSQQYMYQQQLQQQLLKPKFQQGNIQLVQNHMQQQQQQQQNLLQPTQLQSSQQSVMQSSSVMQPSTVQSSLSSLQQNQQSAIQHPSQSMLQQHPSVLRQQQQPQQSSVVHQQQTPIPQQPILPSQQQQQQPQLMVQQPNSTNLPQNQLIGQQNSVGDMQQQQQQQQQRLLSQQNNILNLQQQQQQQQQQQHQLMAQQNNLSNMHQQQLGPQSNVTGLQQQQHLGTQTGNSSMQTNQHSALMLQSKVQQQHQSPSNLLPAQGHQSQPQASQQQLLSQIQSQPAQMQQQMGMQQQSNPLQRDMQQRLQASGQVSGSMLQPPNVMDQQKQLYQPQRAPPDTSPTSVDSTAQTGHTNGADWQEEVYQKIKVMKEMYCPELSEMYQKISDKLQQYNSVPQQFQSDQFEKLRMFKILLERLITVLLVSKTDIYPGLKDKLGLYEKQMINFINTNRPREPVSSLQQGQLPPPHMHSMQQ